MPYVTNADGSAEYIEPDLGYEPEPPAPPVVRMLCCNQLEDEPDIWAHECWRMVDR